MYKSRIGGKTMRGSGAGGGAARCEFRGSGGAKGGKAGSLIIMHRWICTCLVDVWYTRSNDAIAEVAKSE